MAILFGLSLAGVLGAANAGACTPVNSCPKLSDGKYCPVNDVTEHADINKDVAEIAKHLKETPPNYAQAKKVYTNGVYSSKGGTKMRTLQGLAQKDMTVGGKYTNTFYSGALSLWGGSIDSMWQNSMINCLDNTGFCKDKSNDYRTYIINKGAIGIVTAYVTYEMGAAVWKAENGQRADGQAAYAWDEAAAFYVGNKKALVGDGYTGSAPGNLYSPYEFNWKRDTDFPAGTSTHTAAIAILNGGLINIRSGSYNIANVKAAQKAMYKILSIAAIRSAIKYSWKAGPGATGGFSAKYLAEGHAYWRSAAGYMYNINASAVQQVNSLLDLSLTAVPADTPCTIKTLVESMYQDLGITCAMVGKWKDAPAGSCVASACTDSGNTATLYSGSTAWVDMCKAVEPVTSAAALCVGNRLAAVLLALVLGLAAAASA